MDRIRGTHKSDSTCITIVCHARSSWTTCPTYPRWVQIYDPGTYHLLLRLYIVRFILTFTVKEHIQGAGDRLKYREKFPRCHRMNSGCPCVSASSTNTNGVVILWIYISGMEQDVDGSVHCCRIWGWLLDRQSYLLVR